MTIATHALHGIVERTPFCHVINFVERDWILQFDHMVDAIADVRRTPAYHLASIP